MNTLNHISPLLLCAVFVVGCNEEEGRVNVNGETNDPSETPTLFSDGGGRSGSDTLGGDVFGGDSNGGLSCSGIMECFNACRADDEGCFDDCFSDGTSIAQNQLLALDSCAAESSCQDWDCVSRSCVTEVNACQGSSESTPTFENDTGETGSPSGSLSCSAMYDCYARCSQNDDACFEDCYYQGTPTAQQQDYDLYVCWESSGCEDWDCMDQSCASAVEACFGGASTEEGTGDVGIGCGEIVNCFSSCSETDQACFDACFNQGSSPAQEALVALSDCIQTYGCQDDACVQQQCSQQVAQCFE